MGVDGGGDIGLGGSGDYGLRMCGFAVSGSRRVQDAWLAKVRHNTAAILRAVLIRFVMSTSFELFNVPQFHSGWKIRGSHKP